MSDAAVSPAVNEDQAALATPFVKCLVRMIRAQESYCLWQGKSDATLLADFIITRKAPSDPWHGLPRSGRAVEARYVLHRRRACDCRASPPGDIANRGDETVRTSGRAFHGRATRPSVQTSMGSASRRSGRSRRPVRNWSTIRLQPSKPSPTWHGREETDFEEGFMSKLDEMGKKVRSFSCARQLPRCNCDLAEDLPEMD